MSTATTDMLADEAPPLDKTAAVRPRLEAVDLLRGIVMVVMVLDHTREYFTDIRLDPTDLSKTTAALFLTRWITHFCAPTFIFLAGVSAYLYGCREGRTPRDVSRFLLTRGLWLVALELTLVNFAWTFDPRLENLTLQVIWAIGCSMIALAGLVFLPRTAIALVALAMIFGHNLLDGIRADQLGILRPLWLILHEPGMLIDTPHLKIFALYPLIPWIAVLAAGYAVGPVMRFESPRRRRTLLDIGLVVTFAFLLLRAGGLYGDPVAWPMQTSYLGCALAFLDCEKYPPSLLYLLMTLGPAMIALAAFDRAKGKLAQPLITFGRVPFLYYIAHVFLIHVLAIAVAAAMNIDVAWLFRGLPPMNKPPQFAFGLPLIYTLWLVVVALLYPHCRWFAGVKQRRKDWWLTYL